MEVTTRYWLLERSTWKWFLLALLVRGGWFWVFVHSHGLHHGAWGWGASTGDTWSYFDPIDSHLAGNAYRPDLRMPGYGVVYLFFRWFTTVPGAGSMVILVQLFFSALSAAAMHRIGGLIGLRGNARAALFWCYAVFPRVAYFDVQLLSESFCISALVLATHDWLSGMRSASPVKLLMAGLWITWAIFLRPVQVVLLPIMASGLLFVRAVTLRQAMVHTVTFLLPFLLIDGSWTTRNWIMHQRLRPLANAVFYTWSVRSPTHLVSSYVRTYGGNTMYWDPTADIRWFNLRDGIHGRPGPRADRGVELPDAAISEHVTIDSLRALADDMAEWGAVERSPTERHLIARRMEARVARYIAAYRADRPFFYHVGSRLRMLAQLVVNSANAPLFEAHRHRVPPLAWAIKVMNDVLYWTMIAFALLGTAAILTVIRRVDAVLLSFILATLVGVLANPFVARMCEGRYLVPMYPFLCILAAWLIERSLFWRQQRRALRN